MYKLLEDIFIDHVGYGGGGEEYAAKRGEKSSMEMIHQIDLYIEKGFVKYTITICLVVRGWKCWTGRLVCFSWNFFFILYINSQSESPMAVICVCVRRAAAYVRIRTKYPDWRAVYAAKKKHWYLLLTFAYIKRFGFCICRQYVSASLEKQWCMTRSSQTKSVSKKYDLFYLYIYAIKGKKKSMKFIKKK